MPDAENVRLTGLLAFMAISALMVISPMTFFHALNWGRPFPKTARKILARRWALAFYRITGTAIFFRSLLWYIDALNGWKPWQH